MSYGNRVFCCPYYCYDAPRAVKCEGGRVELPDRAAARDYFGQYCASVEGWRRCTVARAMSRFYERESF
ncbi:MAG: hypothetical protein E7298_14615 [Lachnospiraceae bacterium]|nr:hypothetical protein [Lachnospiraceae bacterium]